MVVYVQGRQAYMHIYCYLSQRVAAVTIIIQCAVRKDALGIKIIVETLKNAYSILSSFVRRLAVDGSNHGV